MRINLTEEQVEQLTPYFDRVRATAAAGSPGMLVAQIRWSQREHKYWMEPGFLEHRDAVLITEKGQAV